jgi:tetratricopeptide (TPR) repeat protein
MANSGVELTAQFSNVDAMPLARFSHPSTARGAIGALTLLVVGGCTSESRLRIREQPKAAAGAAVVGRPPGEATPLMLRRVDLDAKVPDFLAGLRQQMLLPSGLRSGSLGELRASLVRRANQENLDQDFDAAIRHSTQALALDALEPTPLVIRSWAYASTKQYEAAIADGRRLVELRPRGTHHAFLSWVLTAAGRPEEALRVADQGLANVQDDGLRAQLHFNKATAHRNLQHWESALIELDDAVSLLPQEPVLRLNRAVADIHLGKPTAALTDAEFAVAKLPGNPGALLARGNASFLLGHVDQALADLDRAEALPPVPAAAQQQRQRQLEQWIELYADYEARKADRKGWKTVTADYDHMITALASQPANLWTLYAHRAFAKSETGDMDGAIEDYTRAIATAPDQDQAFVYRGNLYEKQQRYTEAIKDYETAARLYPKSAETFQMLGACLLRVGEWDRAATAFEAAIRLDSDPGSYDVLFLTVARLRSGQPNATAAVKQQLANRPEGWGRIVASFLAGNMEETEFLARAEQAPTPDKVREQRCEAFYYAGVRQLAAGATRRAHALFEQSIATEETSFFEYGWSASELRRANAALTTDTRMGGAR